MYGLESLYSSKLLYMAVLPLKDLNSDEQFFKTLHLEEVISEVNFKNEDLNNVNSNNIVDVMDYPERSAHSNKCRLTNLEVENCRTSQLLIGLKYDAIIGSLFVEICQGRHFFDRNFLDKTLGE